MEAHSDPLTPAWGSGQNVLPEMGGQREHPHPKGQQETDSNLSPGNKEEALALGTEGHCCTLQESHPGKTPRLSTG